MDTGKQTPANDIGKGAQVAPKRRRQYAADDSRVLACQTARVMFGGSRELAVLLGMQRQAIAGWQVVPAARVRDVERVTGISRHALRPDIFGPPEEVARLKRQKARA